MKGQDITEYKHKEMKGKIHTMRDVIILPFVTTVVKGFANLMTHSKHVNLVVEPVMGHSDNIAMTRSYGVLKPGRGKIDVCFRNHSVKQITLPKWTAMGEIAAANIILTLLALKPTGDKSGKGEATTQKFESQKELLDKIYLTG